MFPRDAHIQQTIKSSAGLIRESMIDFNSRGYFLASNLIAGCVPMSEIATDHPFWEIVKDGDLASYWKASPKDVPEAGELSIEDRLQISRLVFLHSMIIPKYPSVGYLDSNDGKYELHLDWDFPCYITTPQHLNAAWAREDVDEDNTPIDTDQPTMLIRRMPAARVEAFGGNVKLIVTGLDLDFIQAFSLYQNYIENKENLPQPL